jgi:hypothetical protein
MREKNATGTDDERVHHCTHRVHLHDLAFAACDTAQLTAAAAARHCAAAAAGSS